MPAWNTRSLVSLTPLPNFNVRLLVRIHSPQQWRPGRVVFSRAFHQSNSHGFEAQSYQFRDRRFNRKWDITSAALRVVGNLESVTLTENFKTQHLFTAAFDLDQSLIGIGDHICDRLLSSSPNLSRIDLRARFLVREDTNSGSNRKTSPLTTFQMRHDDSSRSRIYKHTTQWYLFPRGGVTTLRSWSPKPCVTIKTVYNHPRTLQEATTPGTIVEPSPWLSFDSRVLRVHRRLYEFIKSQDLWPPRNLTFITELMDLAFYTADQNQTFDRLEEVSISASLYTNAPSSSGKRTRSEYESSETCRMSIFQKVGRRCKAYIALGSNMGDRCGWIEKACQEMIKDGIKIIRTSALYETKAMYVKKQDSFINGVCEVETDCLPTLLLQKLKGIEDRLGRQKTVDKGPRNIDLDILLHDSRVVNFTDLCIPHKSMLEREFVLRPLCDLIPNETLPPHESTPTFKAHLENLPRPTAPLSPLTPLAPFLPPITSLSPTRKTHLMAILNLTPDSFSDGGLHTPDSTALLPTLQSFLSSGATILDIGGQSTRPHAPQVSPSEELSRTLPTINYIRSNPSFNSLALSIDTYRASVATATIEAGANIINDVSAGTMDREMLPTIAKLGCTVILMHMRGTPDTMTTLTSYPSGIIHGVATELLARVRAAEEAGIFRWRIILDPGIGFAKTQAQNLELLRRFDELRNWEGLRGFPWCVGTSRKAFIGKITGVGEARERVMGTAACVTAAVWGGADVMRVHDVKEMGAVVRMGEAIWRV